MAEMDKADDIIQQALMNNPKKFVRDFSQVVMNLENVLIPEEKIHNPPSILDGLSEETDAYLRILGCEMIQTAGFLLQLPQVRIELFISSIKRKKLSFIVVNEMFM